jgi:hypothetical protein
MLLSFFLILFKHTTMKYLVLIMISLFLSVSCTSQEEVKEKNNIQPKESWNVGKKI